MRWMLFLCVSPVFAATDNIVISEERKSALLDLLIEAYGFNKSRVEIAPETKAAAVEGLRKKLAFCESETSELPSSLQNISCPILILTALETGFSYLEVNEIIDGLGESQKSNDLQSLLLETYNSLHGFAREEILPQKKPIFLNALRQKLSYCLMEEEPLRESIPANLRYPFCLDLMSMSWKYGIAHTELSNLIKSFKVEE